jgi:hypothetical protein
MQFDPEVSQADLVAYYTNLLMSPNIVGPVVGHTFDGHPSFFYNALTGEYEESGCNGVEFSAEIAVLPVGVRASAEIWDSFRGERLHIPVDPETLSAEPNQIISTMHPQQIDRAVQLLSALLDQTDKNL